MVRAEKRTYKLILSKGVEYVSSEESGDDDDKTLYRRPFTWIKKKSLRHLDRLHYNSLSTKGKQMYSSRQDGEPSTKLQPSDAPDFLIGVSGDDDQQAELEPEFRRLNWYYNKTTLPFVSCRLCTLT